MDALSGQTKMESFNVCFASSDSFPFDPRYEQMRTTKAVSQRRVFGSQKRDQSQLLNLPDEILGQIIELVAKPENGRYLSQLALVNRECRQLARSHQFADIFVLRTEKCKEFFRYVLQEVKPDNSKPAGWNLGPSIGACIRRLSIAVDKELRFGYGRSKDEDWEQRCKQWHQFIDDLALAIETAMPNLERVYWMGAAELEIQPRLFGAILQHSCASGRLRELALADYTLYLAESILRSSAATLESFVWNKSLEGDEDDTLALQEGPIQFSKLKKFWAGFESDKSFQPSILESFLAAPLESFAPSGYVASIIMDNDLKSKFPLPHLRTFAICGLDIADNEVAEYVDPIFRLAKHYAAQIDELFIYHEVPNNQFISHISGGNFHKLRSLCFVWAYGPELQALEAIGRSLTALEELSFGFQPAHDEAGAENDTWDDSDPPCHNSIIAAILPLNKLVRLGILGDEYIADWCSNDWAWHRYYKEFVWYNQGRSRRYSEKSYDDKYRAHNTPGDQVSWPEDWFIDGADDLRSAMIEIAEK